MNKTKILIADNNQDLSAGIKQFFQSNDFSVVTANNSNSVLQHLEHDNVDFIFYELTMANAKEADLFETIKNSEQHRDIPLYFISQQPQTRDKIIAFDQLLEKVNRLEQACTIDPLTKLHNRRYLEEQLDKEISRTYRSNLPLSCLMIDIDNFKQINDRFGHQAGDMTLVRVGQVLLDTCRSIEIVCRYGGEEFLLVLPEANHDGAYMVAERILRKIKQEVFHFKHRQCQVTVSIGISTKEENQIISQDLLIDWADQALYEAKKSGKDKIITWNKIACRA